MRDRGIGVEHVDAEAHAPTSPLLVSLIYDRSPAMTERPQRAMTR
jgi:hypothetical protein